MASLYRPLAPGWVRLLTFIDDSGKNCTFEDRPIDEAPPYCCLSYAWQDGETTSTPQVLVLNGQNVMVRQNLHNALTHLAPVAYSRGHKFWVDAICINQDDLDERAEQVKLMKRIYEQAEQVMAWVGLATAGTELAVDLIHTLNNFTQEFFNRLTQRTALRLWQTAISEQQLFQQRPKGDVLVGWAELVQMMKRPYWSRAWVHQEVSGSNVTFYCGRWSFTWKELHAFNKFHGTYGGLRDMPDKYMLMLSGGVNVGSPFFDLLIAQENRGAFAVSKSSSQKLATLIRELRLTFCSDARDKVFAALPHATDSTPGSRNPLTVDYSRSVSDIFVDVARSHLQRGDLEILGYIGSGCEDRECRPPRPIGEKPLPSWVPDWRIPNRVRPLNTGGRPSRDYPMLYHPCPDSTVDVHISGTELHIRGFIFDTLRATVPESGREHVPSQLKIKWAKHMKAWSSRLNDSDVTRILNADVQYSSSEESNVRGEAIAWSVLDQPVSTLHGEEATWRHNMRHIIRSVCRDRRVGRTKSDRIGVFPEVVVPGDKIAAFNGGHALYVVRQVPGRPDVYNFIGECYVDLMMDGQLMDLAVKEGLADKPLTLI